MKNTHFTLKELPDSVRPYNRFEQYGPANLSDAELLSIIIKSGTHTDRAIDVAHHILNAHARHKGLLGLNYLTQNDLMKINGIGRVKAIQLLSLCELTKRMAKVKKSVPISFSHPGEIAEFYMQDMRVMERETVMLILLDGKSRKIHDMIISTGTVNSSIAAPREVFIIALRYEAVNIILLHNHPSGDPTPSKEDFTVTTRMKETGQLLGIPLLDHIIIGDNQYISFRERGLL